MGLIKEPLELDFYVDPKPLTKKEKAMISQQISNFKTKPARKNGDKKTSPKKRRALKK